MKKWFLIYSSGIVLGASTLHAQTSEANTGNATVALRDGVLSYDAAWFEGTNPNTAQDMVNRLPGFSIDDGRPVRGFAGAGGNVLINGSRPTSKIEPVSSVLGRTPASRVERIELIRGGAGGVDMQGHSLVANVILRDEPSRQHTLTGQIFAFEGGPTLPAGRYEFDSVGNNYEWGIQLARILAMSDSTGSGELVRRDPDGSVLLREDVSQKFDGGGWNAGANWAGQIGEGRLEFRASLSDSTYEDLLTFISPVESRIFGLRREVITGDVSLRYERPLSERLDIEARLIQSAGRVELFNTGAVGGSEQIFHSERDTTETIGRAAFNWRPAEAVQWESGGELVYNSMDTMQTFSVDDAPVELPLANTMVEEVRAEIFSQTVWRRSDRLTLEAGMRLEHSTIRQSGERSAERSFLYPKPRLAATWSPADGHQVQVRFDRQLGQLNFGDFAASSSLPNDQVHGGNLNLRPQQRWIAEAVYERRFMDDAVLTLTYRHDQIIDVVDVIPLDQGLTAIGNIGDGTLDRLRVDFRLPLRGIGLEGGRVTGHVQYDHTRVADPTTGRARSISRERPFTSRLRFENDVPDWNLTWGVLWFPYYRSTTYSPDQTRYFELHNYMRFFIERTFDNGVNILAEFLVWDDLRHGRDVYASRNPRTLHFEERQQIDPRDFLRLRIRRTF